MSNPIPFQKMIDDNHGFSRLTEEPHDIVHAVGCVLDILREMGHRIESLEAALSSSGMPNPTGSGPKPGDYTTNNYIHFYRNGRDVIHVGSTDYGNGRIGPGDWRSLLREVMTENNDWPDIWYVGPDGTATLLEIRQEP